MRRIEHLGLVGVGGAGGSLVRWGISNVWTFDAFPWPTLVVNVIGCALLAVVTAVDLPLGQQRLLAVGFCGGLTTFSTFTVEIVQLRDSGDTATAAIYLAASVVLGLVAFVTVRICLHRGNGDRGAS